MVFYLLCLRAFDLIYSFPLSSRNLLLDDNDDPHGPQTIVPSPSPAFTGFLRPDILEGVENVRHRLFDPLNVLRFRKLAFLWRRGGYLRWVTELVVKFPGTFGSLDVRCCILCAFVLVLRRNCGLPSFIGDSSPVSIGLSKVVMLGEVEHRMDHHGPPNHQTSRPATNLDPCAFRLDPTK